MAKPKARARGPFSVIGTVYHVDDENVVVLMPDRLLISWNLRGLRYRPGFAQGRCVMVHYMLSEDGPEATSVEEPPKALELISEVGDE